MKYAVIGATLAGNKGAASMLESSIQNLTKLDPQAQFVNLTVYPEADAQQNTNARVKVLDATPIRLGVVINGVSLLHRLIPPLRSQLEALVPEVKAIKEADVLIDEGGITFVDGRAKFLIYNVATLLPAFLLKTPVVKAAQALGPFDTAINKMCARLMLPRMAKIIARGDITEAHLAGLGLENVDRGADLAFGMEVAEGTRQSLEHKMDLCFFKGRDVVGYAPSQVLARTSADGNYIEDTARAIDLITETGRPVALIAHSAREGSEKRHNNDLPVCREIFAQLEYPEKVFFIDSEVSAHELRYLIGLCYVFVTSRFHGMVSALSTGVPPIVIGWSHKYAEVLDDFGLKGLSMSLEESSPERTLQMVEETEKSHDEISNTIQERFKGVYKLAMKQFTVIKSIAAHEV
ncbi:MAG: polysaccharide pyruvyl transferase family protein [Ancrocorticia sp.]|uniref:polysaccharide pyruvyl transferase family protein n=1 Tax=Ancrocorticia sp. TaxID=2593684 RepID=UPI003F92999D